MNMDSIGGSGLPAPSPLLGQHTEEVLEGLLGIATGELERLYSQGVLDENHKTCIFFLPNVRGSVPDNPGGV